MANRIAQHALENNLIKELKNNDSIKPEVFFNKETRFDFLVEKDSQKIFVEVKNVTLFRDHKTAEFPDAITSRGSKHLLTLIDAIKEGYKSYLLFLVQIQNMENFKIAKDIDAEYYKNYILAKKAGVNFLAYRCNISSKKIFIDKKLKIIND
jgi:sugar fermentation stimulation protein A